MRIICAVVRLRDTTSIATLEQLMMVDPAILRGYARGVSDELGRGPLTLDRRDRLLGRAKHLGLGRFEAALVLAVVERGLPTALTPIPTTAKSPVTQHAGYSWGWSLLTTACTIQVAILAAAWWFVR